MLTAKVVSKTTQPIAESVKDAINLKDPTFIKFGVQDAVMEIQDTIEEIPIIGPGIQSLRGFLGWY